jgi:hypothetical protein
MFIPNVTVFIMKKLLFLLSILTYSLNIDAQCDSTLPVSENFSDATAVDFCWDFIDSDGDGRNWYVANNMLVSESYRDDAGVLYPDNWAIAHVIDLRSYSSSSTIQLNWSVRVSDWSFDQERYSVYASTSNDISNMALSPVTIFENLDGSGGNWGNRTLDISSLAGNLVYIAFRHYASVFQDAIHVDNVEVLSSSGCSDSDNDGVCDSDDQCPGFDDTIDLNGNGIPDGCENSGCNENTANFSSNSLAHSGSGSNSTTLTLPSDSQDLTFTISGLNEKLKGKASSKYIEHVVVTYKDASGNNHTNGTFSGANVSTVNISISGTVKSITVSLTDGMDGNTSSNMNVNLGTVTYCGTSAPCPDSDNDGVCDTDDQCPGEDDTIDDNNNGIPDGCENTSSCTEYTDNFANNTLTHSGGGSNSTTLNFSSNSQDVSFSISNINEKLKGKASSKYTEHVVVSYINGSGASQTYATFSGADVSSANITISDVVQKVTVTLSDQFDDNNTSSNMSISLSSVTYCVSATQSRSTAGSKSSTLSSMNGDITITDSIKIYPNPVSETLYIKGYDLNDIQAKILLYNINGAIVRDFDINNTYNGPTQEINVTDLANGLYLLNITDSKGSVLKTQRIIVK